MINVKRRWTQLSCVKQLPDSYSIEYMNRSLHSIQYVCACVCGCVSPSFSQTMSTKIQRQHWQNTHTHTHRPLCFSLYLWPKDFTIVSPKESVCVGGGTVDNRGLVRDWYSYLWLFCLQPHHISVQYLYLSKVHFYSPIHTTNCGSVHMC